MAFAGDVALVTGAASGIGRATALTLARGGARVACLDRDAAGARAVADEVRAAGGEAMPLACDLADPQAIEPAVERCALWAQDRLDVLAHVAGVLRVGPTETVTREQWQLVLDVNLRAPFLLTQRALPLLLRGRGAVVAVASVAALRGWPYVTAYAAAKAGLVGMMRTLAVEYGARGLRANVVCPGRVETPMVAGFEPPPGVDPALVRDAVGLTGRSARPEDVAAAIAFLASEDAAHISGAVLPVEGGALA
ncbi:MAG TPA: SDR family NAD(P)-dependent oxidoreductase [Conexibacter sp.]|nr:SDR family NAD(P)-dependent oxidoreductase [Conexibacter sp.]